jgi:hypothetical protein
MKYLDFAKFYDKQICVKCETLNCDEDWYDAVCV